MRRGTEIDTRLMHTHYDPRDTGIPRTINLLRDPIVMRSTLRIAISRHYASWCDHNEASQRRTGRIIEIIFFGIGTRDVANAIGQSSSQSAKLSLVFIASNELKREASRQMTFHVSG